MLPETAITRRLGLTAPIVQGPFGSGLSSVDLVASVCNAGLLGSFGVHHLDGAGILDVTRRIRERTERVFALNLWIPLQGEQTHIGEADFDAAVEALRPFYEELSVPLPTRPERFGPAFDEQVAALLEAQPAVFSFVYGIPPSHVLKRCRTLDIATIGAATTPAEARALADAGVDMIVATGFEAGGHRVSFLNEPEECLTGTLSLVPQVVDAVDVPVIAAGGIGDGRGIAAALMLGADAVQIGTAFLACEESGASDLHREALFTTAPTQTALTRAFTGRLARGIQNRFMHSMRSRARTAPYPVQAWLTAPLKSAALSAGRSDLLALWSGQAAPLVQHRRAADLIASLLKDTSQQLRRFS